jgi:hypothetical protein
VDLPLSDPKPDAEFPGAQDLVDQLDRLLPKEGAKVRICADHDGNTSIGTQRGYLRLGVELLRTGLNPIMGQKEGPPRLPLDIDYLLAKGSASPFELCEISPTTDLDLVPSTMSRVGSFFGAGIALAALFLIVIGAGAVWKWLW